MTSAEPRDGHVDRDTLALLALDEPVSDDVVAHVRTCEQCSSSVESLRPVVALGRELHPEDMVTAHPPAQIWDRVAAETGVHSTPPAENTPAARAAATTAGSHRTAARGTPRRTWLLVAAVVGALVGAAATLGLQSVGGDGSRVIASATLLPLPTKHGTGSAEVEDVNTGRELSVRVSAPPTRRAYLEVWLMSDPKHLISLGVLKSSSGLFPLPPGLDLTKYKIVDVSVEPYDGNPAHSTDSLVRGSLGPT